METISVTEQQLIQAIIEAQKEKQQERESGMLTRREWEKILNMSERQVIKLLHSLEEQGKLESAFIYIRGIHGVPVHVPAYRIKLDQ